MAMKDMRITSKTEKNGIRIVAGGVPLQIEYPHEVWKSYPKALQEVLRDNLTVSSTFFIPQILKLDKISYASARPMGETFFFKNGIYDMATSAHTDGASSVAYVKQFMNTVASFDENRVKIPDYDGHRGSVSEKRLIVPFTFGKESLLTVALAQEIGMDPHLVYVVEPTHTYEAKHKESLMKPFFAATGFAVHEVRYDPGRIRYGRLWKKNTELGWGLQTTEYVLLSLPFLHYWDAGFVALGNEQSCGEASMDHEGLLTYWTAYDQHPDWTPQQGLLASLVLGKKVQVTSFVEPLHEIAEMAVLYRRYPKFAQFQASCLAIGSKARSNRWCQQCEKCASMHAFLVAVGVNPANVGFTEDLFDKANAHLYENLFTETDGAYYAVEEEMFLALYLAVKRGASGFVLDVFKKMVLPKFRKNVSKYIDEYFGFHPAKKMPKPFQKKIIGIYKKELSAVRQEIKKLL